MQYLIGNITLPTDSFVAIVILFLYPTGQLLITVKQYNIVGKIA
jgi:hypothetical protein